MVPEIRREYYADSRLVRAVNDGHSYEYIYDEYGNLKEKRSNGKRLISYTHDAAGQITEIKDPAGIVTKYEYDIMGRQSRIYNDSGLEVRYSYDALDRISHIRYGNGVETAYAYDADGNISSMETRAGENVLLSFAYEYDGNGNRTAKTGIQGLTAGSSALDISYQYDVRGQLLEERSNGVSTCYAYDKTGNRIRKTDTKGEIRYFYNVKNQLLREEAEDTEKQFTYDRQGGIIEERDPSGIRSFAYDSRHRQTKVETENGSVQENRYDVEGLRFELQENGNCTRFVYHDGELLHEEGGRENRQTGYHLGAGIEAFSRGQEICYYQQDEQLSTAFITGRSGTVHNSYQYDAFGNELETAEQLPNRIRYTGQQYDDATGQYYLRARYYNPILGRFMQEDTYQDDGLNLYAYCKNNPVTYYDPSGYMMTASNAGGCPPLGNFGNGIDNEYGNILNKPLSEWSNDDIQRAVDSIHNAQYHGKWYGALNPISVTISADGKVIVSKNNGVLAPKSRAMATQIFGDDVGIVWGGKKSNYVGGKDPNHAEARGIQYMLNNDIPTQSAKQGTSSYSCESCVKKQKKHGVTNITGEASKHEKLSRSYVDDLWVLK